MQNQPDHAQLKESEPVLDFTKFTSLEEVQTSEEQQADRKDSNEVEDQQTLRLNNNWKYKSSYPKEGIHSRSK